MVFMVCCCIFPDFILFFHNAQPIIGHNPNFGPIYRSPHRVKAHQKDKTAAQKKFAKKLDTGIAST